MEDCCELLKNIKLKARVNVKLTATGALVLTKSNDRGSLESFRLDSFPDGGALL